MSTLLYQAEIDMLDLEIRYAGCDSIIVYLTGDKCIPLACACAELAEMLNKAKITGLTEVIAANQSVLIIFDLVKADHQTILNSVVALLTPIKHWETPDLNSKDIVIPVYYGKEAALDLQRLLATFGITHEILINLHSSVTYSVTATGFAPGFAYLSGLPTQLHLPRIATPRTSVPAGSVGIAEHHSAIYPQRSPAGWSIIGRTTKTLFDKNKNDPSLFHLGDKVSFAPIARDEYLRMGGELE